MNDFLSRDKELIYSSLSKNPGLFLYHIGDLDDFYFNDTRWIILSESQDIVLVYNDVSSAVLLALSDKDKPLDLIDKSWIKELPDQLYAHLNFSFISLFSKFYQLQSHGLHYKMLLTQSQKLLPLNSANIFQLSQDDIPLMEAFYETHYPENWFNKRMVQTGQFFGYIENNQLLCIAGIHVYSEKYQVAAIGSVATHINQRKKGIASLTLSALCHHLLKTTSVIGLNVLAVNHSAIKCYSNIGFEICGEYEEFAMTRIKDTL